MFCRKCGRKNDDDAVYCQSCGTMIGDEVETRVAVRRDAIAVEIPGNQDMTVFSVTPTLVFVRLGYAATAIGVVILVALTAILLPSIPVWLSILIALLLFLIPAYFHVLHRLVRYTLTDSRITIDEGLIVRNSRNVPLTKIQDVSVTATVMQRVFGFGNLVIDNASDDGGKIVLRNIDDPQKHADLLLRQIRLLS